MTNTLYMNRLFSALTVVLGGMLVIYMIVVEDEPGLVPLLLVAGGLVWYFAARYRARRTKTGTGE
jgi:hypothetical protein